MKKDNAEKLVAPLPRTYNEMLRVLGRMGVMGTPSATGSWWQYSRWTWLIARNMRISEPVHQTIEWWVVEAVVSLFWDPTTQTGTRSWLDKPFRKKSVNMPYACDIAGEPQHVVIELLGVIARDLMKVPVTDAEKMLIDALIVFTGNRRYGTGPYFGGVGGSLVSIP